MYLGALNKRETPLHVAVQRGNIKIIKTLIEIGKIDASFEDRFRLKAICYVPQQEYDETRKLEIIQYLLPHTYPENPTQPGHFKFWDILQLVTTCSKFKNDLLTGYFIDNFYSERYNKLYPLIKKLEDESYRCHPICILLHDEIQDNEKHLYIAKSVCLSFPSHAPSHVLLVKNDVHGRSRRVELGPIVLAAVEALFGLILKGTDESMCLAIKTSEALISRHFDKILKKVGNLQQDILSLKAKITDDKIPLCHNRLFQFFYHLLNTPIKQKALEMMTFWNDLFSISFNSQILDLASEIRVPMKKLLEFCSDGHLTSYEVKRFKRFKRITSLKDICRYTIKVQMAQVGVTTKEFRSRVLNLRLPTSLKCFLLNFPDVSWIEDLEMLIQCSSCIYGPSCLNKTTSV